MRKNAAIQIMSQAAMSASGFFIPLLVVHELGGDALDVGLIGAGYGLAQFAASFHFGRIADVGKGGRRRLLKWGLFLSALTVVLQAFAEDPFTLGVSRAAFGFAAGIFPAALTSLAYDENRKLGRFSSWGSLGFGLGTLVGGAIAVSGVAGSSSSAIFFFSGGLLMAAYAVSLTIRYPPDHTVVVPTFPREVIERNLPAYLAMVCRHTGASAIWIILPIYLVSIGADLLWIGVVNAANAICQFLFMPMTDRYSSRSLIVAGIGLSALTFGALMVAPNMWVVLAIQPLLAASWAAMYMGSVKFVLERNVERATSTGLLQSSIHISNVLGPLIGGGVAYFFGGFAATAVVGVALALLAYPVFFYELKRHPSKILAEEPLPAVAAAPTPQAK